MQPNTLTKISRWREILSSCDQFGYLTTSQIQRLHNLGSRRNVSRILNDMGGLLSSFRESETVWYLSAKGRKEIGSENVRKRTLHVQHSIMRNEVYIAYRPDLWKPEYSLKWDGNELVADAIFRKNGAYTFLEIDLTQSIAANERKIAAYRELRDSGKWQAKYGVFPTLMVLTSSDYRKQKLRSLVGDLKSEVLIFSDIT
ncbi:replication-relaxation family protein [Paenibacillus validus]|uniref:replication-relaxation family protein n=1 Tax=Paenibacillus validus TaxID=44253 RepID=UPI000FDC4C45|nr:replication-relaxation family protein [Paenibacillus validus]MED4599850.1 replication-relaxation family protein [Paenibacillus validus]MED4606117.1 replication-relaxation family protein [Paenibacillus validus]